MSEEEKNKTIKEEVLESIKSHRLKMHSKKYFILQAALLVLGIIIIFAALLYLASFIAFEVLETGIWFIPVFGLHGWIVFFRSLPWLIIICTIIFVLLLEAMVRKYSFAYRRPLLYSMLGIVSLVVIGGFFISRAHFHGQLRDFVEQHHIRGIGRFYRDFGAPRLDDIHKGLVQVVTPDGFILQELDGETSTIFITSSTRLPLGGSFSTNDQVIIFGNENNRTIQAFGIRRISQ